jgi:predicted DCC family thiol-disulfide oxidoreductase YuxK
MFQLQTNISLRLVLCCALFVATSHAFVGPALVQTRTNLPALFSTSIKPPQAMDTTNDVILYDGVCNFCNTWVDLLLRIDFQKKFRFAPLQSRVGKDLLVSIGKEADDISSIVLVKRSTGESFDKSRCVLKVVEELGPLAKIASFTALNVVPEELRDAVYDTVAENRYNLMGKRDECRCSDPEFSDRFLLD